MDKKQNMASDMWEIYSVPTIINFLKHKDFAKFTVTENSQ